MTIIKNVSPLGELDVPLLGRFLKYGEEIEVSQDVAEKLLPQAENYEPVDDEAKVILARINGEDDEPEEGEGDPEPEGEPEAAAKPSAKRTRRQSGS